jgi:hypothetical protein
LLWDDYTFTSDGLAAPTHSMRMLEQIADWDSKRCGHSDPELQVTRG